MEEKCRSILCSLREDLQEITVLVSVHEDAQPAKIVPVLSDLTDTLHGVRVIRLGRGEECDAAIQFITITGRNNAIDSGHVKVVLSARMGTYGTQPDTANVTLSFRDGNNHQLTTPHSGSLALASVTRTNGSFKLVSASRVLPQKARMLRVILSASNTTGYCDAYFDNISVKLVAI